MKGFEPVTLKWRGASYEVPADRQLMLVAEIEDALRSDHRSAVQLLMQPGGPGTARLSMAYAKALRFAGASVSPDDVYLTIQEDLAEGGSNALEATQTAVLSLLSIISPPIRDALLDAVKIEESAEKKTQAAE